MEVEFKESSTQRQALIQPDILNQLFDRPLTLESGAPVSKPQFPGKVWEAPEDKPDAPGKLTESPSGKVLEVPERLRPNRPGQTIIEIPEITLEQPGKVWEAPDTKPGDKPGKMIEVPSVTHEVLKKILSDSRYFKPSEKPLKISNPLSQQQYEKPMNDKPGKQIEPAEEKPSSTQERSDNPFEWPGKVGEGPGEKPLAKPETDAGEQLLEQLDRVDRVRVTRGAIRGGNVEAVSESVKQAFEKYNGDGTKFKKYAEELGRQLTSEGVSIKAGKTGFSIHRDGSPYGIEFAIDGNLDFQTGLIVSKVVGQPYDWQTKRDAKTVSAGQVLSGMSKANKR